MDEIYIVSKDDYSSDQHISSASWAFADKKVAKKMKDLLEYHYEDRLGTTGYHTRIRMRRRDVVTDIEDVNRLIADFVS